MGVMLWLEWHGRQPLLFDAARTNVILLVLCAVLALGDRTELLGVNRWIKPMKFCASVAIYLGSLAWFWPLAVASAEAKERAAQVLAWTLLLEIGWVIVQAKRGVRSHFNNDTKRDEILFGLAGLVILVNVAALAVVCWWTFGAEPSAYVWGVRLGMISFIVFALEGVVMARRMGHSVGVPDGGPGLPVVNWSTEGGDLRIAHFLGMHALQLLPLVGYVSGSEAAVWVAFAGWMGLSAAALARALAGKPLWKR